MSNIISIPVQLRQLTGGREQIKIELTQPPLFKTLRRLLHQLEIDSPGIKSRLLDQEGKLRRFVNIYVDGQDCRTLRDKQEQDPLNHKDELPDLNPLDLRLNGDEEIAILPAIAGG